MIRPLIPFGLAPRLFVMASCTTAFVFICGCGSGDGSAESGASKYEVATGDDDESAGSEASPQTMPPGSYDRSGISPPTSPSPRGPSGGAGGMNPGGAAAQPPSTPPSGLNPYEVKGETPAELRAFIESMMQTAQKPPGVTQAEQISNAENILATIVAAADKILPQQADDETLRMAAEAKVACLTQLAVMRVGDAQERLVAFCGELEKNENVELARLGKRMRFAYDMDSFAQGDSDDAAAMVAGFREVIAEEAKDKRTFSFANSVVNVFEQRGFTAEALDALRMVAAAYADTSDPELVPAVKQLAERTRVVETGLREKRDAYMMGQEGALDPLLAGLDTLLQGDGRGEMTLSFANQIAMLLEQRDPVKAGEVYQKLAEAFKDNPTLGETAAAAGDRFAKRSSILGQPFVVEGANLDGTPFDWSPYAGKVVLVDFWATWCIPCLEEIPNIKANLDRYRDRGFAVIGVNLDDERARLDQFLSMQSLPWPSIVSADPNASGLQTPMAAKCGVEAIPFLVLVDRDGTAIELNLRGEALGNKLAELFAEKP